MRRGNALDTRQRRTTWREKFKFPQLKAAVELLENPGETSLMGQGQFQVSLSVGTKLLIGVVSLLVFVIVFLDVSTILLIRDDKRAFIFQSQATECSLVGKEFTGLVRSASNLLRLVSTDLDPKEAIRKVNPASIRQTLESQAEVISLSLVTTNPKTGQGEILAQASRAQDLKRLNFEPLDVLYPEAALKPLLPRLFKNGILFLNLSRTGRIPLIAIAMTEPTKTPPPSAVIAVGFIPLERFAADIKASQVTLATRDGRILFDSNPAKTFTDKTVGDDPFFVTATDGPLASGAQEFTHNGIQYLGSYFRPGLDLIVMTRTEWRKAMLATYSIAEKFVLLGLMSIGSAILFAIFFSKTITAPIGKLYEATRQVAAGDFNVRLSAGARDEIGALSGSFMAMSAKINDLIQESIRKTQLENELAIASTVQQTLFPPTTHENRRVRIRSHYQSATECGGDWWGFFEVGGKMAVMISDATGHGLPSALITAAARSCYSVMNKLAEENPAFALSPGDMLSYANRVINESANGKINMTFFNGVLDFEAGTLTYASAGHNPPWLLRPDGSSVSLTAPGSRLGETRDIPSFVEKTVRIGAGDVLFLYTDGIIEGTDRQKTQYGKKRVRRILTERIPSGPEGIIQALVDDFLKHNSGKELDDDVTLAAFEILETGA
jgi:sigma-B regulation protein RsbU (phosphoserine phosphatase)